ncbi:MAG: hypothetical protein AB7O62_15150 [Pirellulales bacterium]
MDIFVVLGMLALVGWRLFLAGNRVGSRRGYQAGRRRRFSRRR